MWPLTGWRGRVLGRIGVVKYDLAIQNQLGAVDPVSIALIPPVSTNLKV
jgi:hypothetical protein